MANSIVFGQKLSGLDVIRPYPKSQAATTTTTTALPWNPISNLPISNCKQHQSKIWSNKSRLLIISCTKAKRDSLVAYASAGNESQTPSPSTPPPSNSFKGWFLGIFMSMVLPFFGNKLGPLGELKNKFDNTLQTVENIAEAVEKVAEEVDKIAEDIGDDLPQGKLKDLMDSVEDLAEKTAKTADTLDDIIDQVQEADDHLEDIVETVLKVDKKKQKEKDSKEDKD